MDVSSGNELHLYQRDGTAFLLDNKKASVLVIFGAFKKLS